ncbi:hypothetical protein NB231_16373 [Nitrococcus mobilis Nb-231]|uniref:Uncharacterized protein n=1 Tax=Nitrococcus mobilis Nb-231 TaxID=314278 RepID=A4BM75_9GAMM|nr:hypothetical protein NB231_16373 [Nitrococcus mobilis Nb-231]
MRWDKERAGYVIATAADDFTGLSANADISGTVPLDFLLVDEEPAWLALVIEVHPHKILPSLQPLYGVKGIGKPCTREPYAWFGEGGQANMATHRLLRHRQTEGAAIASPSLTLSA